MNVEKGMQVGDLVAIARRRANAVLGVALGFFLAGYWVTMALPNEYESYATVLVEPQSVAPELVAAGVPESDLNQRLGLMTAQILSRPRLSRIIDDLDLYRDESEDMERQEVIDLMREKVAVEPVIPEIEMGRRRNADFEINTFRIIFHDRSAQTAKLVAERLANDFIEEHIEARVEVSGKSLDFIQGELDRLSTEIREVEAAVAKVKNDNPGRGPEDILNNQRRLERITSDLAFAQRSYAEAQSDEAFFRSQAATAASMTGSSDDTSPGRRLQLLELALAEFESRGFTEKHPDIIRTKAEIAALKDRLEDLGEEDYAFSQTTFAEQNAQAEGLRAAQRRAAAEAEIERLENLAAEINSLLAETPAVAEQLDGLERHYQHLFGSYQDFSNRRLEATVQAQLERRQLGEQFRVLEAAFAAPEPTSPDRVMLLILSLVLALAVGAAAGFLVEAGDTSVHSARELQNALHIPVLAAIPQILLESDRRALRRSRIRAGIATAAVVVFALGGGAASYVWVNGAGEWWGDEAVEELGAGAPAEAEG
jgi:polysaccharide chain length determinant protein (PEP-CTERM system associated)